MLYRESGQFKASYAADQAIFPIRQDQWGIAVILAVALLGIPALGNEYFFQAIMIPVLIFSLAAIGLNILTGYCGQLSLGTGGFMAVGAVACYKLSTGFPEMNFVVILLLSGVITAGVGLIFGIPSLRIKGFYLAVATLAAQFFLSWLFNKVAWFQNYTPSGTITMPPREVLGITITGAEADAMHRYLFCLIFVIVLAMAAKNLVRGPIGRSWMAIRDMDIAASVIGIPVVRTKMLAFFVSCFYCGVGGALFCYAYLQVLGIRTFEMNRSFEILFMVIIGGLGSIAGSFYGTVLVYEFPILFSWLGDYLFRGAFDTAVVDNVAKIVYGILIIALLIREPGGLAALWLTAKQKLRTWPFPH